MARMRNAGELDEPPIDRKRVTKRRAETRQRLLGAAFDVFAADGFGRSTVEQICERAGYTRGAFYSNFDTLDDLFLAMWEDSGDAGRCRQCTGCRLGC